MRNLLFCIYENTDTEKVFSFSVSDEVYDEYDYEDAGIIDFSSTAANLWAIRAFDIPSYEKYPDIPSVGIREFGISIFEKESIVKIAKIILDSKPVLPEEDDRKTEELISMLKYAFQNGMKICCISV